MMNKSNKRLTLNKGITLIALVITIIILVILSGIAIATLTGENGILNEAIIASDETEKKQELENLQMAVVKAISKKITTQNLDEAVKETFGKDAKIEGDGPWLYEGKKNNYIIDEEGNIQEKHLEEIASISTTELTLDGGYLLTATLKNGEIAKLGDVNWSSDNTEIVTVNKNGIVMCGRNTGTATITCEGADGTKAECIVTSTAKIVYTNNGNENTTINGNKADSENPILPVGFSAIDTDVACWNLTGKQTDIDKGLAIMDNRGNNFIWVPVPNVIWDKSITTTIENLSYTPMAELKKNSTTDYVGVLYKEKDYDISNQLVTVYTDTGTGNREPDVVSQYDGTSEDPIGITKEGLQSEYNKMVKQVDKYKGFYIGRYETSYDGNINKVASIAGAKPSNTTNNDTYTWYGFYKKQKEFASEGNYSSNMIWGSQYDSIMNWMARVGIDVTSTTPTLPDGTIATSNNNPKTTGTEAKDKINNIYDLLGSVFDLTQEVLWGHIRMCRGGVYNTSVKMPVAYRNQFTSIGTADWVGSRMTLYMR